MAAITAEADSDSWLQQKGNVARIFDQFLAQDELDGNTFDALAEEILCARPIYHRLGHFLVHVYKIPKGVKNAGYPLATDSVLNYMGTAINRTANKFKASGTTATKEFFFCLDIKSSSDSALWLRKLKKKISRVCFERAKNAGEQMDNSETPVYLEEVCLMARSYARAGGAEAATRKLALISLERAAGRSSEVAWTTWDGLKWDSHFKHVFVEVPQSKGSKVKLVAFGAGVNRHADWFLHLADYLVCQPDRVVYSEDNPAWLFPRLQKTSSPGTTMGNFIKALLPADRGGHDDYQDAVLVLPQLPPGITAGGIRPGVCNMLNAAMPAELAVHLTAHDLTKTSAFFEYVDATRAGCMPGSVVVGGWPALPWGHLGMGPKPPSLAPLLDMGISMSKLDDMIDELFRLDTATPPFLWRNGSLRSMVEAAFASAVMYFDERRMAGEMTYVLSAMLDTLVELHLVEGNAPSTLSRWGAAIKTQFDLDNLHLTARTVDTSSVQLVAALQGLGRTVGGLHAQIAHMQRQLAAVPAPMPTPGGGASPQRASPAPGAAASPAAAAVAASPARAAPVAEPDAIVAEPPPPQANPLGSLLVAGPGSSPAVSLSGAKSKAFYQSCMAKGGALPTFKAKQEKPKAETCIKWFNSMANADERASLKPPPTQGDGQSPPPKPDEGARRRLVDKLHGLIVSRLTAAFEEAAGIGVPRDMQKDDYELPVSGIASHLEKLRVAKTPSIDPSTFAVWRAEHEQQEREAAETGGGGSAQPRKKARR